MSIKLLLYTAVFLIISNCYEHNIEKVSYQAATRGFSKSIVFTEGEITLSSSSWENPKVIKKQAKNYWNKIETMLDTMDLEKMTTLPPPSTSNHYDGAAAANVEVQSSRMHFKSLSFDEGNPPADLIPLVNLMEEAYQKFSNN